MRSLIFVFYQYMRIPLAHLFCSISAVLVLFVPTAASAAGNAIVIGQAIDLSGPNAGIGRDYVAGIKTFFDAINANGGINGKRVHYIVRDDQGKPESAAHAITDLIERDQVDYLFGGVGDQVTQAALNTPAFRRSNHILYAPLTTADHNNTARVLCWRPSYKQELRHIFSHFGKLGVKDIGVVYQDSVSNQDAYGGLSAEIGQLGMKLTGSARIGANGEHTASEAARLANTRPRPGFVIVIADTIGTALFLKEFRKHDAQTFVAGTSLINLSTLRELAGAKALEWTVFSQVVPNPSAGTSVLQLEHLNMMKKYRDETVSSLTLEGFAAAKGLARAIQQSKRSSRSALHELLAQNQDIDLGGLSIVASPRNNHLSSYLDFALLKKGSGLMF
jgi:branched-chain amino acid transport system substrate-binding protein